MNRNMNGPGNFCIVYPINPIKEAMFVEADFRMKIYITLFVLISLIAFAISGCGTHGF